jgi:hypothetical protein
MRRELLFVSAALACAGHQVVWAGELTPKEVAAARKLYVAKCAKCHKFHEPKSYSEADWARWIRSMSEKAKLKTEQDRLLRRFLDEYRAGRVSKAK